MVTPAKFMLAIICAILMLALILGMAFIPDNTKDFGINLSDTEARAGRTRSCPLVAAAGRVS